MLKRASFGPARRKFVSEFVRGFCNQRYVFLREKHPGKVDFKVQISARKITGRSFARILAKRNHTLGDLVEYSPLGGR